MRINVCRTLLEQFDCAVIARTSGAFRIGEVHTADNKYSFSAQVEPFARGYEDLHSRSNIQYRAEQIDAVQQVLKAVQQQQHVLVAEIADELCARALASVEGDIESAGDRRSE
jgi:hypothetical protein